MSDTMMKALTLTAYNELSYGEAPKPELTEYDVLIAVKACGICGSDVHGMDGSSGRRRPPIIMGHEAAGEVVEVGAAVTAWKAGDRVTFDSMVIPRDCACDFCREGTPNLCDERRVLGVSCEEYRQHGAMADYVRVPEHIIYRVPPTLSYEQAAFAEPVSIALHAVNRVAMTKNATALVIGCGVIGLLVIQALKRRGCTTVWACDLNEARLSLAKKTGADEVFVSNQVDVLAEVMKRTNGEGVPIVVECVGFGPTVTLAVDASRKGGQISLVGNLAAKVDLPLQKVVTREITLYGSCASSGEYAEGLEAIEKGEIVIDPLLSAVVPLSEGGEWFHRLHSGKEPLIKVVLKPE
jgi:L-iditol 2-dehydrogenase